MSQQLEGKISLEAHLEECTPLQPCRVCQSLAYLRGILPKGRFRRFLAILTGKEQREVARLPPTLPPLEEPISLQALVSELNLSKSLQRDFRRYSIVTIAELLTLLERIKAPDSESPSWHSDILGYRGKATMTRVRDELKRVGRPIQIPGLPSH